jgi:hypothetical protein
MRSSRARRAVSSKYVARSYGWLSTWKSRRDRPTQPKQYVHPLHATERTRYALPEHRSLSTQCWQARHAVQPTQCEQSAQPSHDVQYWHRARPRLPVQKVQSLHRSQCSHARHPTFSVERPAPDTSLRHAASNSAPVMVTMPTGSQNLYPTAPSKMKSSDVYRPFSFGDWDTPPYEP